MKKNPKIVIKKQDSNKDLLIKNLPEFLFFQLTNYLSHNEHYMIWNRYMVKDKSGREADRLSVDYRDFREIKKDLIE